MKHVINLLLIITLMLPLSLPVATSVHGEEQGGVKTEKKHEEKSFLEKMWIKIRKLSPNKYNRQGNTAVAGIKGAEKGSEELKPIWKGDESDKLLAEAAALESAEEFMNGGNFAEALIALDSFRKDYPDSQFMPNVLFMSALCHLNGGKKDEAKSDLQTLASKYSGHELKNDAEELIKTID